MLLSKKISIQLSVIFFSYILITNIIYSGLYFILFDLPELDTKIFRDAFMFSISLFVTGFVCGNRPVFIQCTAYLMMLILFFLEGCIALNMLFSVSIMVFGFSFTILFYKKKVVDALEKNIFLNHAEFKQNIEIVQKEMELAKNELEHYQDLVSHKDRELTSKALLITQYNEQNKSILKKIKNLHLYDGRALIHKINEIESDFMMIDVGISWESFQKSFEDVHPEFYKKLSCVCPELSPSEKKLATFIKLGLTSKEIAALCSNTHASVDVSRSRLRKKLNMDHNENIETFLSQI